MPQLRVNEWVFLGACGWQNIFHMRAGPRGLPVFLNPMDDPKFYDLGQQFKKQGLTHEQARELVRPQILSATQAMQKAKEKKQRIVALWQAFWNGYNAH